METEKNYMKLQSWNIFTENDERFANIFQNFEPTLSVVDISWSTSSSFLVVDESEWFLWF